MKKITLTLASLLLLLACGQNPPAGKAGEAGAINAITAAYGGQVNVSKTTQPNSDKQFFTIELIESKTIEDQIDLTGMFASHVAWLFFENMDEFGGLEVQIKLSTGETPAFQYTFSELETVKNKLPILEKSVALMQAFDFDGLYALLAPERAATLPKESLVADCSAYDKNNGKVTGFEFKGFGFFKPSGGEKEYLHLAGLLKRTGYDTPLSIFVDPTKPEMKGSVQYINFDY